MPTPELGSRLKSVQDKTGIALASMLMFSRTMLWTIEGIIASCPRYWSVARDDWMCDFVKASGNDLLAGAISTLVAKIVATNFYIEGPLTLAMLYRSILLEPTDLYAGWDIEISKVVQAYLNRDAGGLIERLRTSRTDLEGPALGFLHLDESRCLYTGNRKHPIIYQSEKGPIKLHRSQVARMVDMPESRDVYRDVGFCGVSRALTTAQILMDVTKYKQQRLSDLPPAGLLLINNMTDTQWEDVSKKYNTRQERKGNTVWQDLMVVFGLDPAYELKAELLSFSELPEHYDEEKATNIAIYSFALAFRVDPREYWPVSAGPLGTATEATLQHLKAKAKGEGIIFTALERLYNSSDSFPQDLIFRFDYRDDEEDRAAAEIKGLKATWIRRLWEASPNRIFPQQAQRPVQQEEDEGGEAPTAPTTSTEPEQAGDAGMGMITTEEARELLILEDLVPPEVLGQTIDISRVYDVRGFDPFGPRARVYRDGRCLIFNRRGHNT